LPASVSTYTEKFGPAARGPSCATVRTLCDVWEDVRHDRVKAIGKTDGGKCPERSR
jgi:hypothetical protein